MPDEQANVWPGLTGRTGAGPLWGLTGDSMDAVTLPMLKVLPSTALQITGSSSLLSAEHLTGRIPHLHHKNMCMHALDQMQKYSHNSKRCQSLREREPKKPLVFCVLLAPESACMSCRWLEHKVNRSSTFAAGTWSMHTPSIESHRNSQITLMSSGLYRTVANPTCLTRISFQTPQTRYEIPSDMHTP